MSGINNKTERLLKALYNLDIIVCFKYIMAFDHTTPVVMSRNIQK